MKKQFSAAFAIFFCGCNLLAQTPLPDLRADFDNDGQADLVLRNRITGKTRIWYMNGTDLKPGKAPLNVVLQSNGAPAVNPAPTGIDPDNWWRIAGTGKVNADNTPDIIWQHMGDGHTAVWYMGGPDGNQVIGTAELTTAPSAGWRLVGAGYFNNDAVVDLLWENDTGAGFAQGQKAFWYMTSTWSIGGTSLPSTSVLPLTPFNWKTVNIGDYGRIAANGVAQADGFRDGKPDLLLRNSSSGSFAIWIMKGINGDQFGGGFFLVDTNGNPLNGPAQTELFLPLGTQDYGGPADASGNAYSDLAFHRSDFGDTVAWFMQGNKFLNAAKYFGPACSSGAPPIQAGCSTTCELAPFGFDAFSPSCPSAFVPNPAWRTFFDQQWKWPGQDLANSTERITSVPVQALNSMSATITAAGYTLNWNLAVAAVPVGTNTIRFKKSEDPNWQTVAIIKSGIVPVGAYSGTTLNGQSIDPQQRYDFNVTISHPSQGAFLAREQVAQTTVAVNARPLDQRGGVLLLVDGALKSDSVLGPQLDQILADLNKDLVGDGWKVIIDTAPRHTDDYSQSGFKTANFDKLAAIKAKIQSAYTNGANHILIIGHVVIPFSGYINPDGHGRRTGPADAFYGDLDGVWGESSRSPAAQPSGSPPEEWQYAGIDGRMDQRYVPPTAAGSYNGLELAVGRVDFARLPNFGTASAPSQTEVSLINQYFSKARKYRFNQSPYPVPSQAVVWAHFGNPNDQVAVLRPLFGSAPGAIVSGNALMQQSAAYLFGYTGGNANVALGFTSTGPDGIIALAHRESDLVSSFTPLVTPKIAFNSFFCSFHWNSALSDSIAKAFLATPDYGLASLWGLQFRPLATLALGDTLGSVLTHGVQANTGFRTDYRNGVTFNMNPGAGAGQSGNPPDATYLSILGDPTLRLHYVDPPSGVILTRGSLRWTASPDPATQYLVYKTNTLTGFYDRVQASAQPFSGVSVPLTPAEATAPKNYMVRAVKQISNASGSHQALSQGAFYPAP